MTADGAQMPALERDRKAGTVYAISAFLLWGAIPVYFKAVAWMPALEMLAHRTLWSAVFVGVLLLAWKRLGVVRLAWRDRRLIATLAFSSVILAANWLIFIWAIANGFVLQSSLGYYINPLVSVLLGVVFLGERLNRRQVVAVGLATVGVMVPLAGLGKFPWIALSLAFSFGAYGLIRKVVAIDATAGLFVETLLLVPAALAYVAYLGFSGISVVASEGGSGIVVVLASGLVTALPLILFTAGARRLPLATVGFFQYIAPSCHFVLAVFVYGEAFTTAHVITFALIWAALALYTFDMMRRVRTQPVGANL